MSRDIVPDTVKIAEAELREEVEAQRLQDEARFSPLAGCCQYGCDGSGWRDLSEFETSPSSVEADARPSSPPDIFLGGRWLTPCECNAISAYTCVGAKCYPPTYEPPATETYYAILNPAHPLGPTILMENDKGAYGANEIVEACSDAVTALHEHHNDSLFTVKLQVITRVADEEIVARLATWQRPEPKFRRGYLALYARLAEQQMDALIRESWFPNADVLTAEALRRFLDMHRAELMERFIREDVEWGLHGAD